jgi:hypothetical protein
VALDDDPAATPAPTTPAPATPDAVTPPPTTPPTPASDALGAAPDGARHPVLVFTLLRLAVLAVVGGVLWLLGLRGIYLILLAFLVSGVVSAVLLSRRRESAAYGITHAVRSVNARIDASARAEDADDTDEFGSGRAPDTTAG